MLNTKESLSEKFIKKPTTSQVISFIAATITFVYYVSTDYSKLNSSVKNLKC